MKKIMVLTLALVFALASVAFAEVKVGGELKAIVDYKSVDDPTGSKVGTLDGVSLDTAKLTLTAEDEGVFSAKVTLAKDGDVSSDVDKLGFKLDVYELAIYDDLFTVEAWGEGAEVAAYATPLEFVKAPNDADTVRFTSSAFGPEVVADWSGKDGRLFVKYAVDPSVTVGAANKYNSGDDRDYAFFATGEFSGVTLSGEYMFNDTREDDNTKYGVKATTTVSDVDLTGKIVRNNNYEDANDKHTEFHAKAAYEPAGATYTGSFAYTTKNFTNDDKFNKFELDGSAVVVPDFVTINASYVKADDADRAATSEDGVRYEFTWNDFNDREYEDDNAAEYSKFELGASVAVTSKLTLEPSVAWETIDTPEKYTFVKKGADDEAYTDTDKTVGEVKVTTLGVDATYAVTDTASVTYGLTSRTSDEEGDDYNGVYHTLGVSLSF